jgi:hypothetical protein
MKTQTKSIWRGPMVPIVAVICLLVAYWLKISKHMGQDTFDIWMMATPLVSLIWEIWCHVLDRAESRTGEES